MISSSVLVIPYTNRESISISNFRYNQQDTYAIWEYARCTPNSVEEVSFERYRYAVDLSKVELVNKKFSKSSVLWEAFKQDDMGVIGQIVIFIFLLFLFLAIEAFFIYSFGFAESFSESFLRVVKSPFGYIFPLALIIPITYIDRNSGFDTYDEHPIWSKIYPPQKYLLVSYYGELDGDNNAYISATDVKEYLKNYPIYLFRKKIRKSLDYVSNDDLEFEIEEPNTLIKKQAFVREYSSSKSCSFCKQMIPHSITVGDSCPNCQKNLVDEETIYNYI